MDKHTILVVDDEPDVVTLIEHILIGEGYLVLPAYDGISALDIAVRKKPDLILLDLMMPTMSGYEVCEQIKNNPATASIPVVCITSAHTATARDNSLKAGAETLITKPFAPAELIAQVQRYL